MLHLIFLMLCWIFAAITIVVHAIGREGVDDVVTTFSAMFFGTLIWLALEGVYYLATTHVF